MAFFGDAAARRKHENQCFPAGLDLGRCQNVRKHCILPWFLNTRLSRQRLSAQLSVVFAVWWSIGRPPATAKHEGQLVSEWPSPWSGCWAPGPPPESARRGPGASKGTQNTTDSWDFQKTAKNKLFENVHPSRVPGPFWPKRVPDRTPITTDSCVFRSGLKSGPREPKERKSAPRRFLKALNKLGQKTEVHQTLCFTMRNFFRTKIGAEFFQKT